MRQRKIEPTAYLFCLAFLIPCFLMILITYLSNIAPFGQYSYAIADAEIQYLDYFSYLKDILSGNASFGYSFSKLLGGETVALFGYYLSSPLNLLVVFFEKSQLNVFFTLITILKIGLSGLTFSVFLKNRFKNINCLLSLALSSSYALMQYNIMQSDNIMWLDGVYMLPLMMLGVYWLISKNRITLLTVTVALSVLFNWYTAYMNCILCGIYFVYELLNRENFTFAKKTAIYLRAISKFSLTMLCGVGLSMFLFLPVILGLRSGEGTFEWGLLKNEFSGNILSFLNGFVLGSYSSYGNVSLFCGSLALIGGGMYFFNRRFSKKERLASFIFLILLLLSFCYEPATFVFSGFKIQGCYYYRHSYLATFYLIYLAAKHLNAVEWEDREKLHILTGYVGGFCGLLFLLNLINNKVPFKRVFLTAMIIAAVGFFIACFIKMEKHNKKQIFAFVIFATIIIEMSFNSYLLLKNTNCAWPNGTAIYEDYVKQQHQQINEIKSAEGQSFYRIGQTLTRSMDLSTRLTANYCEPMAFGYNGVSHYSSTFDMTAQTFFRDIGYSFYDHMGLYNEPILSSDSLFCVKYVLSDYQLDGFIPQKNFGTYNAKQVYLNPYMLPLGFVVSDSDRNAVYEGNSFEYQNAIFSQLVGKDVELFKPISAFPVQTEGGVSWTLSFPEKDAISYGYIVFNQSIAKDIYINGTFKTRYSDWLAPKTFSIPPTQDGTATVLVSGLSSIDTIVDYKFYYLDLVVLKALTKELSSNPLTDVVWRDGYINGKVKARSGDKLFLSVPYDKGWSAKVNGNKVAPELLAGTLMMLPLEEGNNEIELTYYIRGLKEGVVISLIALAFLLGFILFTRRKSGA